MAEILDSEVRTEFDSGAVRDIQECKGRCDLLPLDVIARWFEVATIPDGFLTEFNRAMENGDDSYLFSALNALVLENNDSLPNAVLELSKHFEKGAIKYRENNWQKSIPISSYINSALRHYFKWKRGDVDEDHYIVCIWNVVCLIWELNK